MTRKFLLAAAAFLFAFPALAAQILNPNTGDQPAGTLDGVVQIDWRGVDSLNSATSNIASTVLIQAGQGVVRWQLTGLTAAGATMTPEGSADGSTWATVPAVQGTGLVTAITADGIVSVPSAGYRGVRLRVSSTGTGTITAAYNASTAPVVSAAAITGSLSVNFDKRTTHVPTVQNAAYASGNCVGGFNAVTLTSGTGVAGLLQSLKLVSIGGSTPTITVYIFDSNPSASTCTDKSTFTLNSADVSKIIGAPFALTLVAPTGTTTTFGLQSNLALPFVEGGSSGSGVSTIYYGLVSGSTFTPASTTDLVVGVGASMDGG